MKLPDKPILRILVIEDNQDLAANIGDFFESRGHTVDFAMDGVTGLHLAITQPLDVVVLDVMLPGMDGFEVCRQLRQEANESIPVLMLTAKDTLDDKITGFNAGADDYVIKPFELPELEVRLHALVHRATRDQSRTLTIGDLQVDTKRRIVRRAGEMIRLNRSGFRILVELMNKAPDVVTREDLEHILWGDWRPNSDVLRSHIYALRKAIDGDTETSMIETVHGVGFRMGDPV